jgi:hypothetical protein
MEKLLTKIKGKDRILHFVYIVRNRKVSEVKKYNFQFEAFLWSNVDCISFFQ